LKLLNNRLNSALGYRRAGKKTFTDLSVELDQLKAKNEIFEKDKANLDVIKETLKVQFNKLKQTLTEIKEIAEKKINSSDCYERMYGGMCARPILQKISEVENG
jgi:FtsZ-binding cell division protein ZapB